MLSMSNFMLPTGVVQFGGNLPNEFGTGGVPPLVPLRGRFYRVQKLGKTSVQIDVRPTARGPDFNRRTQPGLRTQMDAPPF